MKTTEHMDHLATIALGAGLGYLLLSQIPAHAHLAAFALVFVGAFARAFTLPMMRRQARGGSP